MPVTGLWLQAISFKEQFSCFLFRVFARVVESGSFTKAAEVVNKTQSAVSMQMKRLEERLGRPIFARDGRASKLTEDGQRLLDYARRIVKLNMETVAAFSDAGLSGHVRLGVPDDYADRFLVERQAWLTDPQFNASIAIAQAAPGPNVLFIALLGWNVGLNAGGPGLAGWLFGAMGMAVCMLGVMLPSSLLTWTATRWGHRNRERRGVRAFKQGMAPVVIGLLLATSLVLARGHGSLATAWPLWLLSVVTVVLVWRTRLHLLWMLGAGALLGALGWV